MPGLSSLAVIALERGAEQLRHHPAQRGDDQLAERGERRVGVLQRGQIDHEDAAVEHDVAHVDVAVSTRKMWPRRTASWVNVAVK